VPGGWFGIVLMSVGSLVFCLVADIPSSLLRKRYQRRGQIGLPQEWVEAAREWD
jgi:hypothetical protein